MQEEVPIFTCYSLVASPAFRVIDKHPGWWLRMFCLTLRSTTADMEKDQIFPRMCFVNNLIFRKKYISEFLTITRIIVEIVIYRL